MAEDDLSDALRACGCGASLRTVVRVRYVLSESVPGHVHSRRLPQHRYGAAILFVGLSLRMRDRSFVRYNSVSSAVIAVENVRQAEENAVDFEDGVSDCRHAAVDQ